jgi:hypothetical protein
MVTTVLAIAFGIYLVVYGLTGDYFVNESDVPATEEEKEYWKATPKMRAIVVSLGIVSVGYGIYHYFVEQH